LAQIHAARAKTTFLQEFRVSLCREGPRRCTASEVAAAKNLMRSCGPSADPNFVSQKTTSIQISKSSWFYWCGRRGNRPFLRKALLFT